jgi:hypothetical protein
MDITFEDLAERYHVSDGSGFQLKQFNPGDAWKLKFKDRARELLESSIKQLSDMLGKLYPQLDAARRKELAAARAALLRAK